VDFGKPPAAPAVPAVPAPAPKTSAAPENMNAEASADPAQDLMKKGY